MPKALMLILTNAASPEAEQEFNAWYNETHLPELTAIPGFLSATRYKISHDVAAMPGLPGAPQNYLAIYEIEAATTEDLQRVAAAMGQAGAEGKVTLSPALDLATAAGYFALPIAEPLTS